MTTWRGFLLSIFSFAFAVSTQAGVIDFETGSFIRNLGQTGISEGFTFTTTGSQPNAFIAVPVPSASCGTGCVSDGTNTLGAFNGANVAIAPVISTPFALASFDVAGTHASGSTRNATSIQVIGDLFGGGQVSQTFLIDPSVFQTLTLNSSFVNLSSVEFDGLTPLAFNSPEFQLDNITYSSVTTPEPASIALLAASLLGTAFAAVRRKHSQNLTTR